MRMRQQCWQPCQVGLGQRTSRLQGPEGSRHSGLSSPWRGAVSIVQGPAPPRAGIGQHGGMKT